MKTIKESPSCNAEDVKNWPFLNLTQKVSIGPYNLIELKTEKHSKIYLTSNGVFNETREKDYLPMALLR